MQFIWEVKETPEGHREVRAKWKAVNKGHLAKQLKPNGEAPGALVEHRKGTRELGQVYTIAHQFLVEGC